MRAQGIHGELEEFERKQRRLIDLYVGEELPAHLMEPKRTELEDRRTALEAELAPLQRTKDGVLDLSLVADQLPQAVQAIRRFVANADGDEFELLLEAVDAEVVASAETIEVHGSVPVAEGGAQPALNPIEQTSA